MGCVRKGWNALKLVKGRFVDHDDAAGFGLALKTTAWLYPVYRFSEFGQVWLGDEEFTAFLHEYVEPERRRAADRMFFLQSLLGLVGNLPGDVAECGTYRGASAVLLCRGTDDGRCIHLFDSFEGLSPPDPQDSGAWQAGDLAASPEFVESRLRQWRDRVRVHAGWIPDRFEDVSDRTFCFVYVDVDLYQPTLDSLEFFYPRLVPGGLMLFDDYGIASCPGQKKAVDEFLATRPEQVVHVPTGQGFFLKQRADSAAPESRVGPGQQDVTAP